MTQFQNFSDTAVERVVGELGYEFARRQPLVEESALLSSSLPV